LSCLSDFFDKPTSQETPMKKFTSKSLVLLAALASTGALAQIKPSSTTPRPPASPTPAPGLYVAVLDGAIKLSNKGGTTSFAAGQFGFTPSPTQPPVIVPRNPGILFTPPTAFVAPSASNGAAAGNKPAAIDCVVR
jgi:hypothetical protein